MKVLNLYVGIGGNRKLWEDLEGLDRELVLRNCVEPELGLHILNESKIDLQPELFR